MFIIEFELIWIVGYSKSYSNLKEINIKVYFQNYCTVDPSAEIAQLEDKMANKIGNKKEAETISQTNSEIRWKIRPDTSCKIRINKINEWCFNITDKLGNKIR